MTYDMSLISFLKLEGAGNDFVVLDLRKLPPAAPVNRATPATSATPSRRRAGTAAHGGANGAPSPLDRRLVRPGRAWIRALLDRRRGVGGDGLLVLVPTAPGALPVARFRNPDGSRAAFCGNGARCVARLLLEGREAGEEVRFRLERTPVAARRGSAGRVRVLVPVPVELDRPVQAPPVAAAAAGRWIDAGVPHWVVPVADLDCADLDRLAVPLRAWPALGRGGTNVTLAELSGGVVRVRTFERGVEGETLACGSGLAAAGWWAATVRGLGYPVRLRTRGGDELRLTRDPQARGLWLEGPVRKVFSGLLPGRPERYPRAR